MCLGTYAHVVAELDDSPQQPAEDAIMAARTTKVAHQLRTAPDRGLSR
jgi:hypothetical protein